MQVSASTYSTCTVLYMLYSDIIQVLGAGFLGVLYSGTVYGYLHSLGGGPLNSVGVVGRSGVKAVGAQHLVPPRALSK